jgi:hypothetical protein
MILDLQKASLLKRASAYLLDIILLLVMIVGFAAVLSSVLNYDTHSDALSDHYLRYEKEYGIEFDMSSDKYAAMTEEEQLQLLSSDGMLVKRPLLITEDRVLTGFREAEWETLKE